MRQQQLEVLRADLLGCRRCPNVFPPVVTNPARLGEILLLGQAPGPREGAHGRPFAHTAGKRLFSWFADAVDEATFREGVYMAAVLRCFPGKAKSGGDRVPAKEEIAECRHWLDREIALLEPKLIIAVGSLAIVQVTGKKRKLVEVVGKTEVVQIGQPARAVDLIALPHPSGVSTWHKKEPGISLLTNARAAIVAHPAWHRTFNEPQAEALEKRSHS